jgi:peptidoglycan L-alanyl-D-glutamate endopeptidase CwlK
MYKLSKRSLERIEGIEPILIDILKEGIKDCPIDFGIPKDGGFRTTERQEYLYSIGRTRELSRGVVTWTKQSYHMSGKAFDVYAYVGNKASWKQEHLQVIAEHLKKVAWDKFCVRLKWGFDMWGKDSAHFQI